jgi:hypothetical protein
MRTAQTASSHTPNRKPKSNTARAARLIVTFHDTRLVHGWSLRVVKMTGVRGLEDDMFVRGKYQTTEAEWGGGEAEERCR